MLYGVLAFATYLNGTTTIGVVESTYPDNHAFQALCSKLELHQIFAKYHVGDTFFPVFVQIGYVRGPFDVRNRCQVIDDKTFTLARHRGSEMCP
jgi:hypothetical protein